MFLANNAKSHANTLRVRRALCTKDDMEELLARLDSEFDEAEGWIRIVDADWYANDLRLNISVSMDDESQSEIWEVSCVGVVEDKSCL